MIVWVSASAWAKFVRLGFNIVRLHADDPGDRPAGGRPRDRVDVRYIALEVREIDEDAEVAE